MSFRLKEVLFLSLEFVQAEQQLLHLVQGKLVTQHPAERCEMRQGVITAKKELAQFAQSQASQSSHSGRAGEPVQMSQ